MKANLPTSERSTIGAATAFMTGSAGRIGAIVLVLIQALSCSDATAPNTSAVSGKYSGVIRAVSALDGTKTAAAFVLTVDATGHAAAGVFDINTGGLFNMAGTVDDSGNVKLATPDSSARLLGQISAGRVRAGTWSNGSTRTAGTWYAEREGTAVPRLYSTRMMLMYRVVDVSALVSFGVPGINGRVFAVDTSVGMRAIRGATGISSLQVGDLPVAAILYAPSVQTGHDLLMYVTNAKSPTVNINFAMADTSQFLVPSGLGGLGIDLAELFLGIPAGNWSTDLTCKFGLSRVSTSCP